MSQTALHSHMVGFVGGPRVSCKSQFESQPPAWPPHLLDVVMRGYSVDDAIDGEEEHRQAFDGIT